jgi:hypothetical protein
MGSHSRGLPSYYEGATNLEEHVLRSAGCSGEAF